MNDVNKLIRYNSLLLIYQELLTNTQKEILTDYFMFNLSLSEIAESRKVSRAAIEDAIKKGQNKLDELENKLLVFAKNEKISELIKKMKSEDDKQKINSYIEELERIIK